MTNEQLEQLLTTLTQDYTLDELTSFFCLLCRLL